MIGSFSGSVKYGNNGYNKIYYFDTGRSTSVAYESDDQVIWVSTNFGLNVLSRDEKRKVKFEDEIIYTTDLKFLDGKIWVASKNHGVLVYEERKLIGQIDENSGLLSDEVYKMKYRNGKLYLAVKGGFQEYDMTTKRFRNLTKADGLTSDYIHDFEVVGDKIWMVFNNGLLQMEMETAQKNKAVPSIDDLEVFINNQSSSDFPSANFTYQQNELEFTFRSYSFGHQGTIKYAYQLDGLNSEWRELPFENNSVGFPALPPGNYTFRVKVIDEHGTSSEVKSFPFSIALPFWRTLWFYLLCVLAIIAIVSGLFYDSNQNDSQAIGLGKTDENQ